MKALGLITISLCCIAAPLAAQDTTHARHPGMGTGMGRGGTDEMMGMMHGMSLHADFWNTWNQTVLERTVADCLNAGDSCDLGG